MPTCKHCLIEFPAREAVRDGEGHVFCCHGCKGIYSLIHGEGLDHFYERRDGWNPGPTMGYVPDMASFARCMRPDGDVVEADLVIDGIRCASCVWLNEKVLERSPGVKSARVNYATHRARVRFDPRETSLDPLLRRMASFGYIPKPYDPDKEAERRKAASRDLLLRFGTAGFLSMQLMVYTFALYAGYFSGMAPRTMDVLHVLAWVVSTPVLFYSGWPFLRGAWRGIVHLNFNMDVLIAAGASSAYFYSIYQLVHRREVFFDTAAMIITFILLGRYIETGAKGRASEAITRLMALSPAEARRVRPDGAREMAEVGAIGVGELVEVLPGGRVPLDGTVEEGSSEVDEAMLTGEPAAVAKARGDEVYAGTMNTFGTFVFRVTRTGPEVVLQRIVRAVEDAQHRRASVQALADRVVGWFVPAVLVLAAGTLAWRLFVTGSGGTEAMMHAVSVLVIACPCALGLATPLALVVGTTNGASRGIFIRGGDVVERSGRVDVVALDKTGTVTEGRPELLACHGIGMDDTEALRLAAGVERGSEHALGASICRAVGDTPLPALTGFEAVAGGGVAGTLTEGARSMDALVGTAEFLEARGVRAELPGALARETAAHEADGATVVCLAVDGALAGVLVLADRVRPDAADAVRALGRMGCEVVMFTGDARGTAEAVAARVGIGRVEARMSPMGKAEAVAAMRAAGRRVVMVGDGVNDAPALVEADVGIAMGRATDVALESADMVLVRDRLMLVPDALRLARRTLSVIRLNVFWAFFYNVVTIPLAVAGVLHPIVAAIAMAASSVSVVLNSLRARIR